MFVCSYLKLDAKKGNAMKKLKIEIEEASWEMAARLGAYPGEALGKEGDLESELRKQCSRENN